MDAQRDAATVPWPARSAAEWPVHGRGRAWAESLGGPLRGGNPAASVRRFTLFAIVTCLPYLVMPRTWVLAGWAVSRLAGRSLELAPALAATAAIPGRLLVFHVLVLLAWWLPGAWRVKAAVVGALAIGLGFGIIDVPSLCALTLLAALMWGVFHLPIPRFLMLCAVVAGPLALRGLAHAAGWEALDRTGTSLGLLVLLWYACYQVTTGKATGFADYAGYLQTRFFMEGPVLAPDDVRGGSDRGLDALRWAGVKALAIALFARVVVFQIDRRLPGAWQDAAGLELLLYSYLNYVALSCALVFSYNLPLGLMRLLGFPVRDNFSWWFLARTPNEHWRRWNMLFREWLITFTFYPMMRAKRPLFVAIMSTLLISGVLHVYGRLFGGPLPVGTMLLILTYWVANGLAIYVVVSFPRQFPRLTARLRLAESRAWWVVGWLATNAFYAVLFFLHHDCAGLADAVAYLGRLTGSGA
jgi:hypothetical protein